MDTITITLDEYNALRADKNILDFLDSYCEQNGFGWVARESATGRGFRLHQDPKNMVITARQAMHEAIQDHITE